MSSADIAAAAPADSPESRKYNRIHRWLGMADFGLGLGMLAVLVATGWNAQLRDLAYRAAFQHYVPALTLYVLMLLAVGKILGFGLDFYRFRLEHRFHLSNLKLRSWLKDEAKGFLVGFVLAAIVVDLLYFIIRQYPLHWWLLAWAVFLGLVVLMAQLAPVILFPIFYRFEPLQNDELKARLVKLGERAGTKVRGVYKWNLSEKSKKANAALTGLGSTRRIILADTLLDNYSTDEIEAVLAHELGHHVHRHIAKSIAVQAAITFAGFWAANWMLHYSMDRLHLFETLSDFANLPLLILGATILSFLLMPALNAYSRYNERQADHYAFRSIPAVQPFISSMNKLADQNLAERAPSKFVEWFFHSHPAISHRIEAAQTWARSRVPQAAAAKR